ncbi:hypothetical protein BDV36DRAFT_249354 [Aspergillus pseudocaelatus]|uniref:Uncharacterized protein n=1 Tax=Aspergillus pseudocaelatus TaxID=1825620 RepID=A0ABQ6WTN9_9EURO|nr:hypothetical protein BDV36DRAFT_249354 [Aspergillus pseudocaelatus]
MALKSMLGRFTFLFLLTWTSSAAMSFTRYSKPVPEGLIVCETREQMNQAVRDHPETVLHDEGGGYYLKDMNGIPVAVAADSLCSELDNSFAEADAMIAQNQLKGEDQVETEDDLDTTAGANACAHRRCFNSVICITYRDCHICSSRHICI